MEIVIYHLHVLYQFHIELSGLNSYSIQIYIHRV